MNGVEILTSAQVATEFAFHWTTFWILLGIIFGVCFIIGICYVVSDQCNWGIIPALSIAGIVFGAFAGMVFGTMARTPITYETQYKVTISEEISMTEFYKHYEVIEQDGKIFTVREKTNEKH